MAASQRDAAARPGDGRFDLRTALGREVAVPIFDVALGGIRARDPEWFNEDEQLKEGLVSILDCRDGAVEQAVREWARERNPGDWLRPTCPTHLAGFAPPNSPINAPFRESESMRRRGGRWRGE